MEEKELEALNEAVTLVKGFKKDLTDKADKKEAADLLKALNELKTNIGEWGAEKIGSTVAEINKGIEKLVTRLDEMAEDVAKSKENGVKSSFGKSFGQMVVDALKEGADLTKPLRKGEHRTVEVSTNIAKVVANMTTANVTAVGTNAIPYELSDFQLGLTRIVRRSPYLLQIANVSTTNKMYVQWAEQANPDGAANETAQGSPKNQIDFDWVEKSAKVEKITAYIKVSKEALDDLDGLRNEIDTELRELILLKVDTDLLSGDGTTPTLNGLLNMDTAYSAGSFAGTVVAANKADVLRTAIAQVVANLFIPNYAILHPDDVASMDLIKDSNGSYSLPPFRSADGMVVSGVRIIENTGQTVDKFTVGDFTKMNVRIREGLTIDMGLDADDFTRNLITILGEIRLVSYVKTNHIGAFVSGDFSDAIASLDAGS